jgi:hypothetical protein
VGAPGIPVEHGQNFRRETGLVAVDSVRWRYICVIDIVGEPVLRRKDLPAGSAAAAVSGESDAEVYARLAPELIRFAVSTVGPSDAEDLVRAAVLRRSPPQRRRSGDLRRCSRKRLKRDVRRSSGNDRESVRGRANSPRADSAATWTGRTFTHNQTC